MRQFLTRAAPAAFALSLGLALAGCGGMATNQGLESIHQPVVDRTNYTMDVTTGPGGLSPGEQSRLAGWFEAMNLRYGDRIAIDDPLASGATRDSIEAVASRYGLLVSYDAPPTPGPINAGTARVIVSRTIATVPGCPDWSANSGTNLLNATSSNYGCATNGNLAAMIANPEHLIKGASGDHETTVMSSTKAIATYRSAVPTGAGGLKQTSSQGGK
ncbi:MAG: CpaD family pilus assembly protein [Novosphingobium sp.]|nr:CpaD family pilus assembly protein [Novosphingobium sp.]